MERLKGFRDIYPEDAEERKLIFSTAEKCSEAFGFKKIEFPSLELLDLYRIKSGSDLLNQTFSFVDKGGREVTLTPEATPSVVRMLVSRKDIRMPAKWYSFQRYWRYEDPQSGRQREFYQYNADIFGTESPESDAEIIGLACFILDSLGLAGKYRMQVNDRILMESILSNYGLNDPMSAFPVVDKIKKIPPDEALDSLVSLGISREKVEDLYSILGETYSLENGSFPKLLESIPVFKERYARIKSTMNLLHFYTSSPVVLDLSVVRGLGYYTGIVFEAFDTGGTYRSILGGGRYDGLATLMSGRRIPAVGFGMGDVILEILMKENSLAKNHLQQGITVCYTSHSIYTYAIDVTMKLRSMGFRTDIIISEKSLSAQLKQASFDSSHAIILGENELNDKAITVRNLHSGEQRTIKVSEIEKLRSILV
ncbi:MAG: histidine--tRNA ligase [Candidatus Thermoplasmatota archaeon]|nr:histidine--tRNA ligase [Candidatus Thermoplasmatota archaeon]